MVDDHIDGGQRSAIINGYFASHPEQVVGKMAYSRSQYDGRLDYIADFPPNELGSAISERLSVLPENDIEA